MTTLTDEQADQLVAEDMRSRVEWLREEIGDWTEKDADDVCVMVLTLLSHVKALKTEIAELQKDLAFLNSRPSPRVQPISGAIANAGQTEGSAQATPSPPPLKG